MLNPKRRQTTLCVTSILPDIRDLTHKKRPKLRPLNNMLNPYSKSRLSSTRRARDGLLLTHVPSVAAIDPKVNSSSVSARDASAKAVPRKTSLGDDLLPVPNAVVCVGRRTPLPVPERKDSYRLAPDSDKENLAASCTFLLPPQTNPLMITSRNKLHIDPTRRSPTASMQRPWKRVVLRPIENRSLNVSASIGTTLDCSCAAGTAREKLLAACMDKVRLCPWERSGNDPEDNSLVFQPFA